MANFNVSRSSVAAFLDRYRRASASPIGDNYDQCWTLEFGRFRSAFLDAKQQLNEINRLTAGDFNMFQILGLEHKELAHSSFLANLLDPQGSHGQAHLFLGKFVRLCEKESKPPFRLSESSLTTFGPVWITKESTLFEDRCDLMIQAPDLCLLIENKIKADELDKQLRRYRTWLDDNVNARHKILVFLTINGRSSSDPEMKEEEYVCISYARDLRDWLFFCKEQVEATPVRLAIDQYLKVIAVLEGKYDATCG